MESSLDVSVNSSSFRVFVSPTSSFLFVTLFRRPFPCPLEYNLIHTIDISCLLLPVFFRLFF
jgi:hypothetical protein